MFTREEASRLRHEFWTTFGRYMSPVPSSEGVPVNWVNYHTGIKDVYFRMEAGQRSASIAISLEHKNTEIQARFFNKFLELKTMLHHALGEEWDWLLHVQENDKVISRIFTALPGVSVLNKDQWPDLISFFKPRIIALDSFWENAKYGFAADRDFNE